MTADEIPCWHDWCGAGECRPWQGWVGQLDGCWYKRQARRLYTDRKCQAFRAANEWPVYRIVFWVETICQREVHVIWSCRINVGLGSVLVFVRPVILVRMLSGWAVATRPRHDAHAHPAAFLARISWARYCRSRNQTCTWRIILIWGGKKMACMW